MIRIGDTLGGRRVLAFILAIAGVTLLPAGLLFFGHDGFAGDHMSVVEAAEAARGRPHAGALVAVLLNFFLELGPIGNGILWTVIGALCLRGVWSGRWKSWAS